jgi:hypothetical protein
LENTEKVKQKFIDEIGDFVNGKVQNLRGIPEL